MLPYITQIAEYFNLSSKILITLVFVIGGMQLIVEVLKFRGVIVPEILDFRKRIERKKKERETLSKMTDMLDVFQSVPEALADVKKTLQTLDRHYSEDNISKRNNWMKVVDDKLNQYDSCINMLSEKMDKNHSVTISLAVETKRSAIIDFASYVADEKNPVTREQFNRIMNEYEDYEAMLDENGMTNGQTNIAIRIIRESYEQHLRNHTFIEDIRGYDI